MAREDKNISYERFLPPSYNSVGSSSGVHEEEDDGDLKRGPWSVDEDSKLVNYISSHGEGRWNSLARSAGLKRTGKSCRLRWLNYLRPDVRRGDITLEEQLVILDLRSRWGNRWSKIAQHLPGRTDNDIKNYWRTRVQKQAKHLKCDVDSQQFKDAMQHEWIPRLIEQIQAGATAPNANATTFFDTDVAHPNSAAKSSCGVSNLKTDDSDVWSVLNSSLHNYTSTVSENLHQDSQAWNSSNCGYFQYEQDQVGAYDNMVSLTSVQHTDITKQGIEDVDNVCNAYDWHQYFDDFIWQDSI